MWQEKTHCVAIHSISEPKMSPPFAAAVFNPTATMCFSPHKPSCSFSSSSSSEQQLPNHLSIASKPKTLLHENPLYQPIHSNISLEFKEKILCLEVMGIDSGKALSQNPSLHTASLYSLHCILTFLQSKGIHQKDFRKIFGMCPKLLTSDIKSDLAPVFDFLSHDLQVPQSDFRKVINKCPRLLRASVSDRLKPALFFLKKLGFKDFRALAIQDPILLVSSVQNTLIPKLNYLVSLGFSTSDAAGMVLRCPGLLTFSIENNYKPKFDYFVNEMMGELEELKDFPQYFSFSLEKRIKKRHMEIVERGVQIPLGLMLKASDENFYELIRQQETGYHLL